MTDSLRLSIDKAYEKLIINDYSNVFSVKDPVVHIVGGQPGSGKSAIKDFIIPADENMMIIDGDEHRKLHPNYPQIKKEYPDLMPELTQEFSQALNEKLINYAIKNKIPFAVETTFWSAEHTKNLVNRTKENGYTAELHVMAVNPEISRFYTIARFENGKQNGSIGRTNAKDIHDDRVIKNVETLQKLSEDKVFGSINIYGRGLKNNQSVTQLLEKNPIDPVKILVEERSRSFSQEETSFYSSQMQKVLSSMERRGEKFEMIIDFKNEFKSYLNQDNKARIEQNSISPLSQEQLAKLETMKLANQSQKVEKTFNETIQEKSEKEALQNLKREQKGGQKIS